jgi:hypothetical protein
MNNTIPPFAKARVKPAWYVPLLRWCKPGRFVLEVILGRSLGHPWKYTIHIARVMTKNAR